MAEQLYGLTRPQLEATAKAVEQSRLQSMAGQLSGLPPVQTPQILGKLTTRSTTDETRFAWQQVIRQHDGSYLSGPLSGSLTEFSAFNLGGTAQVNDVVTLFRMQTVQLDGTIQLQWCFYKYDICFGLITTDWVEDANTVNLTAVVSDIDDTPNGRPNFDCYIYSPFTAEQVRGLNLLAGQVVAYVRITDGTGYLLPVRPGIKIENCDGKFNATHANHIQFMGSLIPSAGDTDDDVKVKVEFDDGEYTTAVNSPYDCTKNKINWNGFTLQPCGGGDPTTGVKILTLGHGLKWNAGTKTASLDLVAGDGSIVIGDTYCQTTITSRVGIIPCGDSTPTFVSAFSLGRGLNYVGGKVHVLITPGEGIDVTETDCGVVVSLDCDDDPITHSAITGYDSAFDGIDWWKYPITDSITIDFCARTFTRTTTTGSAQLVAEGEECPEPGGG